MKVLDSLLGPDGGAISDKDFQLLLLASLIPPLGNAIISPLLNTLTGTFGVTDVRIGLMITLFTAPSIVLIPLVGVLSDMYGRKVIMVSGLLLFGGAGTMIGTTTDFTTVLGLRFVQGFGFAALTPILVTSVGDLFEGPAEVTAQGVRFAASGVALLVFPLVAGLLIAYSWQFPFFLYAVALPIAVVILVWFRESKSDDGLSRSHDDTAVLESDTLQDLITFVRQPSVMALLIARSIPNFLYIGFFTYNSFVVVRILDATPDKAGLVIAIASIGHISAATQTGRLTMLFPSKTVSQGGATVTLGLGISIIASAPSLAAVMVGSVIAGAGFGLSLSLYRSSLTSLTMELRGGVVSIGSALGRLAATTAPIAMGATVAYLEPIFGQASAIRLTVLLTGIGGVIVSMILLGGIHLSTSGIDNPDL